MYLQDDVGFWKVPFGKCWIVFCERRLPISWRVLFCSCMYCRSCCCRVILSVQRKNYWLPSECIYSYLCKGVSIQVFSCPIPCFMLVASLVSRLTYQFACQVRKYWRMILRKRLQIIYGNESCLLYLDCLHC